MDVFNFFHFFNLKQNICLFFYESVLSGISNPWNHVWFLHNPVRQGCLLISDTTVRVRQLSSILCLVLVISGVWFGWGVLLLKKVGTPRGIFPHFEGVSWNSDLTLFIQDTSGILIVPWIMVLSLLYVNYTLRSIGPLESFFITK